MQDPRRDPDSIPSSPGELLARQRRPFPSAESEERCCSETVGSVLQLLVERSAQVWEVREIALSLLRRLESFHDHVLEELQQDPQADRHQIARWAVEADRLYRARVMVESIELE